VKPGHSSAVGRSDQFRTTRWSVVLLSAQSQVSGSKEALAELCKLYWYPLYGHIRRYRFSPHDAQDLTQGFFLDLLEHKALTRVDQQRGKFRSFLLASLKNFLSNEAQKAQSLKRGGQVQFVDLDVSEAEDRYGKEEPAEHLTPEKIFDARWATTLLNEAMVRLGNECAAQGKAATLQALEPFLDPSYVQVVPSYEQVADQLQVSIGAVKTLIHRLRKQFSAILREEVARTVSDPAEINEEIHSLCEALVASEGRLGP